MRKFILTLFILFSLISFAFCEANTSEVIASGYDPDVDAFYNTSNLFADDGNYAYADDSGLWFLVWWSNRNIPYQAKPTGVVIKLEHWDSDHCNYAKTKPAQSVYITFDGGTTYSSAKTFYADTGPVVVTLGSSNDLWGLDAHGPIVFNDAYDTGYSMGASFKVMLESNFEGVTISCEVGYAQELRVDYISAIIYYKMPDDPREYTAVRPLFPR